MNIYSDSSNVCEFHLISKNQLFSYETKFKEYPLRTFYLCVC